MNSQTLYIVRGLPGSGKSTRAALLPNVTCLAADDAFVGADGVYRFNPKELKAAHADCLAKATAILAAGHSVAVANTFIQRWEMGPYITAATWAGARLEVIEPLHGFDGGKSNAELAARNIHGVPEASIAAMRLRWEIDWKTGGKHTVCSPRV